MTATEVDDPLLVGALLLATILSLVIWLQRRRLRLALDATETRLDQAQRIGEIGYWEYSPSDDTLTWSDYLCEVYGRASDGGNSCLADVSQHLDARYSALVASELAAVVQSGQTRSYEIVATLKDGTRSIRRIVAAPQRDRSGHLSLILGTDQDISARRECEQVRAQLNEVMQIGTVNVLAATLAHELNQPLTAAMNFNSIVRLKIGEKDAHLAELVADTERQLVEIANLVASARQFMVSGRLPMSVQSLGDLAQESAASIRNAERWSNVILDSEVAESVDLIVANPVHVKHVLANLLTNAIEAVPDDEVPIISIRTRLVGKNAEVSIADNGNGFDESIEPFEALSSTKENGLGLGLALSRAIVEAHGGQIWIERSDESGTEMRFSVPLLNPEDVASNID